MANLQQLKEIEANENAGVIVLKVIDPDTKQWVVMTNEQRLEHQKARRTDWETSNSLDKISGIWCKIGLCAPTRRVYKEQLICFDCQSSAFRAHLTEIGLIFPISDTVEELRTRFPMDYVDFLDKYKEPGLTA